MQDNNFPLHFTDNASSIYAVDDVNRSTACDLYSSL